MPSRNYQLRGPITRTALITIRVSQEERELLQQIAAERGETLSRMMVSRSLPKRKRTKSQTTKRRSTAIAPVAIDAPGCVPESSSPARPDETRLRDAGADSAQGTLFDELGSR